MGGMPIQPSGAGTPVAGAWSAARRLLGCCTVVVALAVSACSGPAPFLGPTTSSISLRSADLPSGLKRCPGSGDVAAYLAALKKANLTAYTQALQEWNDLRRMGATSADVEVFASERQACSGSFGGSAKSSIAISYVVQYKDEGSAHKSFQHGFLGLAPQAGQQAPGLSEGGGTGLGSDSWSFAQTVQGKPIFLAYWHQHAFTAFLGMANLASSAGHNAAAKMNGRLV